MFTLNKSPILQISEHLKSDSKICVKMIIRENEENKKWTEIFLEMCVVPQHFLGNMCRTPTNNPKYVLSPYRIPSRLSPVLFMTAPLDGVVWGTITGLA